MSRLSRVPDSESEIVRPERIVKPRTRRLTPLPVIAIAGDEVITEAGELMTVAELVERLPDLPPSLFATVGAPDFLAYLETIFAESHPAAWQWRTSDHHQRLVKPPNGKATVVRRAGGAMVVVHYFGFKGGNFHKLIDPSTMFGKRLSELLPGDDLQIVKVMRWATQLRDYCDQNNLEVRPTMGALSVQFLTDKRFYPNPRRKVPSHTNERARENLPGNHYHLVVCPSPDREYRAYYIDQHRAHHYHAERLRFPSANHLYGYGHFISLGKCYRDHANADFMGLYCLDLSAPAKCGFSWLPRRGIIERAFVFTNELDHLRDSGYNVIGVRAAWGSRHRDEGLNKYAAWASHELDTHDWPWLKPLLLSTYGTLACRRTYGEAIFRLASRGKETLMLTGHRTLRGTMVRRPVALEPRIVNVIQRGMIEAATRSESVGLAQHLTWQGQRVLSIYADAVLVEVNDDKPLPVLPEPWRLKHVLNHYKPITSQAFISDGMKRLPGVSRELREYRGSLVGKAPRRVSVAELMERDESRMVK